MSINAAILAYFGHRKSQDATISEVATGLGIFEGTARRRVNELARDGKLKKTIAKRNNQRGSAEFVWTLLEPVDASKETGCGYPSAHDAALAY